MKNHNREICYYGIELDLLLQWVCHSGSKSSDFFTFLSIPQLLLLVLQVESQVDKLLFCFCVCSVYVYQFIWMNCNNVVHLAIIHPSVEMLEA